MPFSIIVIYDLLPAGEREVETYLFFPRLALLMRYSRIHIIHTSHIAYSHIHRTSHRPIWYTRSEHRESTVGSIVIYGAMDDVSKYVDWTVGPDYAIDLVSQVCRVDCRWKYCLPLYSLYTSYVIGCTV